MICDICGLNNAVIHIEKHAGEEHSQFKVCCKCAGIEGLSPENLKEETLQKLISDLAAIHRPAKLAKCSFCGTDSLGFEKTTRVGCGRCYEDLAGSMRLARWQGSGIMKHVGRTPYRFTLAKDSFDESVNNLHKLEDDLQKCISNEQYERAAELRDRIEVLRQTLS
jgi:protein arginine kinase activator